MTRRTFEQIRLMTYEELGAIEDPMDLAYIECLSPMFVAYVVRTDQLDSRYAGVALPELLNAINNAMTMLPWNDEAVRKSPAIQRDAAVDAYLDSLDVHVRAALRPH